MIEDEFLRNGVAAVHLDAGAAGAEIDNAANGRAAFRIGEEDAGLGDQTRGPDTMVSSMLSHVAQPPTAFPIRILTDGFIRTQYGAVRCLRFNKDTINLSFIWSLQV